MKKTEDMVLKTFRGFNTNNIVRVPLIVVYNGPKDYPDKYVARLWDINSKPTQYIIIKDTMDEIRASIPVGMTKFEPFKNDDPVIVETWM